MEPAPLFSDIAEGPDGGKAYFVRAKDGTRSRFVLWPGGDRGLAVVFPGRTECLEKYGRMARKLVKRGFSVVVIDWRGQGLADRLNNNTEIGHVSHFSEYQQDLDAVLSHPVVSEISGPRTLFAHSMGGCIGLRALLDREDFSAAVFSAPMWGLNLQGADRLLAPLIASLGVGLGIGEKMMSRQPKGYYLTREPFEGNNLTSDENHWHYMRKQIVDQPDLALGSPSFRWLKAAIDEMKNLAAASMPDLPTLTFVGGDESIVNANTIKQHKTRFSNGKLVEIPGARHEIWMETPDILNHSWAEIDTFLTTAT